MVPGLYDVVTRHYQWDGRGGGGVLGLYDSVGWTRGGGWYQVYMMLSPGTISGMDEGGGGVLGLYNSVGWTRGGTRSV